MRPLAAADVVRIWDQGQAWHPIDRALLLLAYALPEVPSDALPALSVGQRNLALLKSRQLTIGDRLEGLVNCPKCQESLEFNVQVTQLLFSAPEIEVQELVIEPWHIRYRLPNSLDLAALLPSKNDAPAARLMLIERCLLAVSREGEDRSAAELSEEVILQVANAMSEADPLADMRFRLTCQACGHEWSAIFDILLFFWEELAALAKRLLREVHQLARTYGWRETEILAMSSRRRQIYLELIGA
jgi:hypothetical protein